MSTVSITRKKALVACLRCGDLFYTTLWSDGVLAVPCRACCMQLSREKHLRQLAVLLRKMVAAQHASSKRQAALRSKLTFEQLKRLREDPKFYVEKP